MTSKLKLLTAFFVLSFAMMMGVLPFNIGGAGVMKAEAASTSRNNLTVTWGDNGNASSSRNENKITISKGGEYTISSTTTTSATVAVETKEDVTINLSGVSISSSSASPIDLSNAGDVTITLAGTNELTFTSDGDNYEYSGITVPKSGKLTITSADGVVGSTSGVLNVTVDVDEYNEGSAIGRYNYDSDEGNSDITINGGTITATILAYENCGAAIGSYSAYCNNSVNYITINGGKITATVTGTDSNSGAAIGVYTYDTAKKNDTNITITGGEITAETSSEGHNDGPAIGVYACDYYENAFENKTDIIISNATITAKTTAGVANSGVAIGAYTYGHDNASFVNETNITINSGEITAEASGGNNNGSAIGAYTCDQGNVSYESHTNIIINDGTITATAAATGTGVDILGEVMGTNNGSAIGVYVYGDTHFESDNYITINGGEITAVATATRYNYGSAIGGYTGDASSNESDTNITISGGTIKAYAPSGKAVKQGSGEVCILPDSYALDVKYSTNYDSSSGTNYEPNNKNIKYMLCAAETDISGITGNNNYFYCSVDGTKYQISDNISVVSNNNGDGYNVIVSVFGGDGAVYGEDDARYLDEVMVLVYDTTNGNMEESKLTEYKEYAKGLNGYAAIGFPVNNVGINDNTIIFALVKTFDYKDAENNGENVIYYLSKTSSANGGVEA